MLFMAGIENLRFIAPPRNWRTFDGRLDAQKQAVGAHRPRRRRPAALLGLVAAALLALVVFAPQTTPEANAAVLLEKSILAERRAFDSVHHPVLHQRLRVTLQGAIAGDWDVWKPIQGKATTVRFTGTDLTKARLLHAWKRSGVDSAQPLSAETFQAWRSRAGPVSDIVAHDRQRGEVTITTKRTNGDPGDVTAAALTLKALDFTVIAQSVWIGDGTDVIEVRVERLISEVLCLEDIPAWVRNDLPSPGRVREITANNLAPETPAEIPDIAAIAIAEAKVIRILHELGVDTNLSWSLANTGTSIDLYLMADSELQSSALLTHLQGLPKVKAHIGSPERPVSFPDSAEFYPSPGSPIRLQRSPGVLNNSLISNLGSNAAAEQYINQVHTAWRTAMAPALALERLAHRYPEHGLDKLPPEVQQIVQRIAEDYGRDARNTARSLTRSLDFACQLLERQTSPVSVIAVPAPWQTTATLLVTRLRSVDAVFNRLFLTDERAEEHNDQDLATLRADLEVLTSDVRYSRDRTREDQ